MFKTHNLEDLYRLVSSVVKEIKASAGFIWNTFEELEHEAMTKFVQDFPNVPMFPIGSFHKYFSASSSSLIEQDQSSITWLNTRSPKSVLYVSFGSLAEFSETEFLEIAWGLVNSMQPFLWVVRPRLIRGCSEWLEDLPNGFMAMVNGRGHIVKWAHQQEVLAHFAVGGFWTHNGWNSTLESICEGVPMICLPRFADQMVNARYVSDIWRVGLHLENKIERGEIGNAIRKLMVGSEGEELRQRSNELKENLNTSLRHGDSSCSCVERLTSYILSL